MTYRAYLLAGLLALTPVSACGLKPLYGEGEFGSGPIKVSTIDGRMGHRVQQELRRSLSSGLPGVAAGTRLDIDLQRRP